jgi:ribosomal-protein-alanine N-acetyltransferase
MKPVEYTIRLAQPADAGALASIDATVNFSPWDEQQFGFACSGLKHAPACALVVEQSEHGGRVDGFVVMSQILDQASILSIAVRTEQQGKGLGYLLLKAILVKMYQAGAARCLLEVRQSNVTAKRLYKRSGFLSDGVRKNYYPTAGGREDALLLSLDLEGDSNERA